jgi:two-component system chemotaxis response regulator CheY
MAFNVLIVDDSAVMRAMILKTLDMTGLPLGEIYQAGNGQEGLDALDKHWIDLAVLDINMPVMNGEEMIDRMRENPETKDVRVIVISSEGSENRIKRLQQKGASFIQKPFTPEIVRDAVVEITGIGANDE